jgi:hypothetical protein
MDNWPHHLAHNTPITTTYTNHQIAHTCKPRNPQPNLGRFLDTPNPPRLARPSPLPALTLVQQRYANPPTTCGGRRVRLTSYALLLRACLIVYHAYAAPALAMAGLKSQRNTPLMLATHAVPLIASKNNYIYYKLIIQPSSGHRGFVSP